VCSGLRASLGATAPGRGECLPKDEHVGVPRPLNFCPQPEFRAQNFDHLLPIPSTITVSIAWLCYIVINIIIILPDIDCGFTLSVFSDCLFLSRQLGYYLPSGRKTRWRLHPLSNLLLEASPLPLTRFNFPRSLNCQAHLLIDAAAIPMTKVDKQWQRKEWNARSIQMTFVRNGR
jgi:hypothetical protein